MCDWNGEKPSPQIVARDLSSISSKALTETFSIKMPEILPLSVIAD
jgi:hypothetical protein